MRAGLYFRNSTWRVPGGIRARANESAGGQVFRRHDAACERPHGRLRAVLRTELGQDVSHVCLDGLFADVEGGGDVLVRLAERDVPKHLELARSEIVGGVRAQHAVTDRRIDER